MCKKPRLLRNPGKTAIRSVKPMNTMTKLIDQRLLKTMVTQWTTRVVTVKSLELDVVEKRDGVLVQ